MKVQDVMLQAMARKITWWQAAEILGISDRHMGGKVYAAIEGRSMIAGAVAFFVYASWAVR